MYTHITYAQLQDQLAARLGDPNKIFWGGAELRILLSEALRKYGLMTGFWRARGVFSTTAGTAFYNIYDSTILNPTLLTPTVTDRDVIQALQYKLLESATSQTAWTGTEMFTLADLTQAIQRRRNQFLSDTGCVVTRSVIPVLSPPVGREQLADNVIDVRRAAWLGASPLDYYVPLWREDERMMTAASQTWSVDAATPEAYSVMAPPPLQLQLEPVPLSSGQLELLTVDAGADLDPIVSATVLGIPDDLTPGVTWGALSDLLSIDGAARDPVRSQFAEAMYQQYVLLARLLPVVVHAELNGIPLIPATLQELESSTPNWENIQSTPSDVVLAAPNLVALNPVPDGVYSVTLDVVRRTPIPVNQTAKVQIGREQLDTILDDAEHLALFKVGGAEWKSTFQQEQNFMKQSVTYNQRLSAAARAALSAGMQSQRQKQSTPRRIETGIGLGALRG